MFWKDQSICQETDLLLEPRIISTDRLDLGEWDLPLGYSWVTPFNLPSDQVIEFINQVNGVSPGSITCLDLKLYQWIKNQHSYSSGVIKNGRLHGLAFTIIFPGVLNGSKYPIMNTVYLCIHPDSRKSGLAPVIIRDLMSQTSHSNAFIGYHQVSRPIGVNSVLTCAWIRPLSKWSSLGIDLPEASNPINRVGNFRLEKLDKEGWKELYYYVKPYPVRLTMKGIKSVYEQGEYQLQGIYSDKLIGIVGYRICPIKFTNIDKVFPIIQVDFYFGHIDGLNFCLDNWNPHYPLAHFYQVGPLTEDLLEQISAYPTDQRYINWYNWTGNYQFKDILLPLI